jgi:hypothetical protein
MDHMNNQNMHKWLISYYHPTTIVLVDWMKLLSPDCFTLISLARKRNMF